jgi:hypothetical protein
MIASLLSREVSWMVHKVIACSTYARCDLEDSCFLKVEDSARVLKSEAVTLDSPTALPYDWRYK